MATNLSSSKISDIKDYLDSQNISYNSRAKKAELLALALPVVHQSQKRLRSQGLLRAQNMTKPSKR